MSLDGYDLEAINQLVVSSYDCLAVEENMKRYVDHKHKLIQNLTCFQLRKWLLLSQGTLRPRDTQN